jgi:general secretion pathway protein J
MTPAQRPPRGLTLVEVVVALAVLSLIVLAMGASLRGMSQSAARVDGRVEAIDEMRVAVDFLRDLLGRVSSLRTPGPEPMPVFDGRADSLSWVAVMPARFGAGGRHAFRLAAETLDDGATGLVLRHAPMAPDAVAFPDWTLAEPRVLARQVERLALSYGGQGVDAGWQADWTLKDRLPPRVRLVVGTTAGDWPLVVLPVRAPAEAGNGLFTIGGRAR